MTSPRASIARQARQQLAATVMPFTGPCTRTSRRCPDARDYQADLRPCCRGHIRQIVADTMVILTDMGITWWADYGTLLGAVRNPLLGLPAGIIPHDKDADFGVFQVDFHTLGRVRSKLERQGYHVLIRPGGRSMKVHLSATNYSNADFFNWFARPDGTLARPQYIGVDKYKGRDFHRDAAFPLTTVPWEGLTLPAPKDPAAFCAFRYGPGWMTPIRANNDGVLR